MKMRISYEGLVERPWHLWPREDRDLVIQNLARLTHVNDWTPALAAIHLLESAIEFDDDALVVRVKDNYVGHVEDWDDGPMGIFVRVHTDGGLMSFDWRLEQLTPLTPAAAALLAALRGDA